MTDTSLGQKRLISMPDRMTSCIRTENGRVLHRPSAVTGSQEDMPTIESWWKLWINFMFLTPIRVRGTEHPTICSRLETIPRAKYPAVTEAEEAASVPLQALCLAIFDAILVHMLSIVAPATWQPLKRALHRALHEDKVAACVAVLRGHYAAADVIFIQEACDGFAAAAWAGLDRLVLRPPRASGKRSQVSLILVHRARFREDTARDVTDLVLARPACAAVDRADLCVAEILSAGGRPHLLASFHGDSAGRSTAPALAALDALHADVFPGHILVVGLDANTSAAAGRLGHDDMSALLAGRGLASCWSGRNLAELWTTFSARTSLQPQLHKAVGPGRVLDPCHRQLKDWILFRDSQVPARRRAAARVSGAGTDPAIHPAAARPDPGTRAAARARSGPIQFGSPRLQRHCISSRHLLGG